MGRVHVVSKQWREDRVLGRFARHLVECLGWTVGKKPDPRADLNYWMAFLEWGRFRDFKHTPTAVYLTHLDDPKGDPYLHRLFSEAAAAADLRVCMNQASRVDLEARFGRTVAFPLPLELEHFEVKVEPASKVPMIGFSGYGYRSGRKGAELAEKLVDAFADRCRFKASGRRWPCPTKKYRWREMPAFFRSLDLYVCTALIEGGPMTTLEAMASGIPVVIPSAVGIHDEIPDTPGVFRYAKGDSDDLLRAVEEAVDDRLSIDRGVLREATSPHSVEAWCEAHRRTFAELV